MFRIDGEPRVSTISTLLFPSFAQWFTDGFLMTDMKDRRKTHTSHQIDLNPLYGLTRTETLALRRRSERETEKGQLKIEGDSSGEEFAPRLYDADGNPKKEFSDLRPPLGLMEHLARVAQGDPARAKAIKAGIFAFGGERANATPLTSMLNTLFLREHNRIARQIEKDNPKWDDERVFQTARNVMVVLLIKIVVEEYINHIAPYHFQLSADPSACWDREWNKTNWIPIEFNLLYRWHSLMPDTVILQKASTPTPALLFDNHVLRKQGVLSMIRDASAQPAWEMGLFNSASFLEPVERAGLDQARVNEIGSYNDYREAFGFPRLTAFAQTSSRERVCSELARIYKNVDNIEFLVGIFAEDMRPNAAVPSLIGRMVAHDAFSQALTNPLLSKNVFNKKTFSDYGWSLIAKTTSLADVVARNYQGQDVSGIRMNLKD